jgi:hypothetical protein
LRKFFDVVKPNTELFFFLFQNEMDLGVVSCSARNVIGRQEEPCLFHVIAARRPRPLANCSVKNK